MANSICRYTIGQTEDVAKWILAPLEFCIIHLELEILKITVITY